MADIAAVLLGLKTPAATLLRGKVLAVHTGTVDVELAAGTAEGVGYDRDRVPAVNDQVILLAQQDFGIVVAMILAARPANPALPAQVVTTIDPSTVSNWQITTVYPDGAWFSTLGPLIQSQDRVSSGVWFYARAPLTALNVDSLAKFEMQLERTAGDYVDLTLHSSAAPTGAFLPDDSQSHPVRLPVDTPTWVTLPLAWGKALIAGTALGITARSLTFDATLDLGGTLRFTSL